MKLFTLFLFVIICFPIPTAAQAEDVDHYSVNLVQAALSSRSQGVIIAKIQTYLTRMGDAAAIVLFKIFTEDQLKSPQTIESFLPILRDAFSQPQFIAEESDKKPAITLFLLNCIHQNTSDAQVQEDIRQTIEFVKQKGAELPGLGATP